MTLRRWSPFLAPFLLLAVLLGAASVRSQPAGKYWIFFKDKGPEADPELQALLTKIHLTERAQRRRARVLDRDRLVDFTDLPIWSAYLDSLRSRRITPWVKSKWLNAVSAHLTGAQVRELRGRSFVRDVRPVLRARRRTPIPEPDEKLARVAPATADYVYDYGPSLAQNELSNIPRVHDMGDYGQGVLIAVFDTGFRLNHEALGHLQVLATYDFINHDPIVDNEESQDKADQVWHGTSVLSILAGFREGELIGPAFGAEFLLAKTEDVSSETPVEEDNWIAAAEWADSLGADIISSSLGYLDWYTYEDMDGNTAAITVAADLAVKKGMLVVTAAGNEGRSAWRYIIAPADGDSVIAVGAVNSSGDIASFSSYGPTSDGRIKPEVVAMGVGVRTIRVPAANGVGREYNNVSGTSAATPIVAGVAALLLSAHPDLSPMEIRRSLMETADRALSPDNRYGYGLVNAWAALQYWGPPASLPDKHRLIGVYPNPFRPGEQPGARILFELSEPALVAAEIYNVLGERVRVLGGRLFPAGSNQRLLWDGTNEKGLRLPSGIYWIRMRMGDESHVLKMTLLN